MSWFTFALAPLVSHFSSSSASILAPLELSLAPHLSTSVPDLPRLRSPCRRFNGRYRLGLCHGTP